MERKLIAGLIGLLMTSSAMAADTPDAEWTFSYNMLSYEESVFETANPSAIGIGYTKWTSPNLGYDFRAGFGMSEDTITSLGVDVDLEVNSYLGAYARYAFNPDSSFKTYGALGFTRVDMTASAFGVTADDSGTDLSYALGFDWKFSKNAGLNMEYMLMYSDENTDLSTINIGLVYTF